jgi:hypothetical protein
MGLGQFVAMNDPVCGETISCPSVLTLVNNEYLSFELGARAIEKAITTALSFAANHPTSRAKL